MAQRSLQELRAEAGSGPPFPAPLLEELRADRRSGAQALYRACLARQIHADEEAARLDSMLAFEREAAANGFLRVAGVDEAGRGPLAGPIVAAAVVLSEPVAGLNDSKQLTAEQREALFTQLRAGAHTIGVGVIEAADIDRLGIQTANYAAMAQAVAALHPAADFVLVDGFHVPGLPPPQARIVRGDQRSLSIAAASIIAKVTRDRLMEELDRKYPAYGFARHKGYATRAHLAALERFGPCAIHRRSFAPLASSLRTADLFSAASRSYHDESIGTTSP